MFADAAAWGRAALPSPVMVGRTGSVLHLIIENTEDRAGPPYLFAMLVPAIQPVVQAAWKLNPPVMPSMSRTSPAKWSPGTIRLSMVLKLTSFSCTPPQVTNSSLFMLLPVTGNWQRLRIWLMLFSSLRENSAQRLSTGQPEVWTRASHKRDGIGEMGVLPICLAGWSFLLSANFDLKSSSLYSGSQSTIKSKW
jgi:hypothetical protein